MAYHKQASIYSTQSMSYCNWDNNYSFSRTSRIGFELELWLKYSVVAVEAGKTSGIGVGIVTLQSELGSMLYGVDQGPASEYFNINSLTPCDVIWHHRTGSSLDQVMACCLTASWHTEAEAKWLPVCIKHFQIDSIETQFLCFIQIPLRMFLRFILIRL